MKTWRDRLTVEYFSAQRLFVVIGLRGHGWAKQPAHAFKYLDEANEFKRKVQNGC